MYDNYLTKRIIALSILRGKIGRLKNARFYLILLKIAIVFFQSKNTTKCKQFFPKFGCVPFYLLNTYDT